MTYVIGFTGLAGVGKTTASYAVYEEMSRRFPVALSGFADPIRAVAGGLSLDAYNPEKKERWFGFELAWFHEQLQHSIDSVLGEYLTERERAHLYAYTVEGLEKFTHGHGVPNRIGLSAREFMQVLGTEGGQRVRQDLWADIAHEKWCNEEGIVLVPDVRFEHELGGLDALVLVTRPGRAPINDHISERLAGKLTQAVESGDTAADNLYHLTNSGSAVRLEVQARSIARRLMKEASGIV